MPINAEPSQLLEKTQKVSREAPMSSSIQVLTSARLDAATLQFLTTGRLFADNETYQVIVKHIRRCPL